LKEALAHEITQTAPIFYKNSVSHGLNVDKKIGKKAKKSKKDHRTQKTVV